MILWSPLSNYLQAHRRARQKADVAGRKAQVATLKVMHAAEAHAAPDNTELPAGKAWTDFDEQQKRDWRRSHNPKKRADGTYDFTHGNVKPLIPSTLRRAGQRIISPHNWSLDRSSIWCLDGCDCPPEFVLGHNSPSTGV